MNQLSVQFPDWLEIDISAILKQYIIATSFLILERYLYFLLERSHSPTE